MTRGERHGFFEAMNLNNVAIHQGPAIVSLNKWLEQVGISTITGWRWRKAGWLKTVNICGRVYLTQEAISEFLNRAKAGEFAVKHKVPNKGNGQMARGCP
jgi:hypothetical protein